MLGILLSCSNIFNLGGRLSAPKDTATMQTKADAYFNSGYYNQAAIMYSNVVNEEPENSYARWMYVKARSQENALDLTYLLITMQQNLQNTEELANYLNHIYERYYPFFKTSIDFLDDIAEERTDNEIQSDNIDVMATYTTMLMFDAIFILGDSNGDGQINSPGINGDYINFVIEDTVDTNMWYTNSTISVEPNLMAIFTTDNTNIDEMSEVEELFALLEGDSTNSSMTLSDFNDAINLLGVIDDGIYGLMGFLESDIIYRLDYVLVQGNRLISKLDALDGFSSVNADITEQALRDFFYRFQRLVMTLYEMHESLECIIEPVNDLLFVFDYVMDWYEYTNNITNIEEFFNDMSTNPDFLTFFSNVSSNQNLEMMLSNVLTNASGLSGSIDLSLFGNIIEMFQNVEFPETFFSWGF